MSSVKFFKGLASGLIFLLISGLAFAASPNYLRLPMHADPPSLDPGKAQDLNSIEIIEQLFVGLTDFDPNTLEVIPELATRWEASKDGKTYTFYLRKDVKWTNGKPVTAHDIVWAVRRNVDGSNASFYASFLFILENGEEINRGKIKDVTKLGVKALNNWTVQFKLTNPAGYFPSLAGLWIFRPLPRETIEKNGDKWTDPRYIISNGSYTLEEWKRDDVIKLKKNPNYYDAQKVRIDDVRYYIIPEPSTGLAMYENDQLDFLGGLLDIPGAEIPRIKEDSVLSKELKIEPNLCTYYMGFNSYRFPTNIKLVRMAISAAIDRQLIIDKILKGGQQPAYTFTRPPIFGSVDPSENIGIRYNPEQAKKWLAEAGFPNGKGFPVITYLHNTSETHAQIAQAYQAMLKRNLNINIKIENQEWKVYLKTREQLNAPHTSRGVWCADYPDANNWLFEVFQEDINTERPWKNSGFHYIVKLAQMSSDQEERKQLYKMAEKILVEEDVHIAPIYFYTSVMLSKPRLKDFKPATIGGSHVRNWSLK